MPPVGFEPTVSANEQLQTYGNWDGTLCTITNVKCSNTCKKLNAFEGKSVIVSICLVRLFVK